LGKTTYTPHNAGKPAHVTFKNASGATIASYNYTYLARGW
jgi:hypothetical protein